MFLVTEDVTGIESNLIDANVVKKAKGQSSKESTKISG